MTVVVPWCTRMLGCPMGADHPGPCVVADGPARPASASAGVAPGLGSIDQGKARESGDHLKLDGGKDPWHLAPWEAFRTVIMVLAFGAKKYRPNGWREGMAYSRLYSATLRHLTAWWMREGLDPDTGFSHLSHAATCVCFLIAYELDATLRGNDDRPILQPRPL